MRSGAIALENANNAHNQELRCIESAVLVRHRGLTGTDVAGSCRHSLRWAVLASFGTAGPRFSWLDASQDPDLFLGDRTCGHHELYRSNHDVASRRGVPKTGTMAPPSGTNCPNFAHGTFHECSVPPRLGLARRQITSSRSPPSDRPSHEGPSDRSRRIHRCDHG